jgi:hypothetical protein
MAPKKERTCRRNGRARAMNEGRCGNARPRWLTPSVSRGGPALREYSQRVISEEARKGMEKLDRVKHLLAEVDQLKAQISELQSENEKTKKALTPEESSLPLEAKEDLKRIIQSGFVAGHDANRISFEIHRYFAGLKEYFPQR